LVNLRITIVTPSLSAGGAERSVVLLSEGFLQRGYDVAIVTLYGTAADVFAVPDRIQRLALNIAADSPTFIHGSWRNLNRLVALRKAIRATEPDVVISNMTETNVLTKLALANTGHPVIMIEHSDPARNARSRIWELLRRLVYPRAASLVSVSSGINDYFTWLSESRRVVIPNPVGSNAPQALADGKPPLDPNKKWIAAMGRLIPVKGFDRLLPAFAKLARKHVDWALVIMGEGELRPELEETIVRLDLKERVLLNGFVSDPIAILENCEFFVMCSRSEGFPYALLEAMSCGLPVVAMDCASGPREIIRDGTDGILVLEGDVEALSAAMDRLMADNEERDRLGERAAEVRERFGLEKIIQQWETLFATILPDRKPRL
jgi:GalNAc-alpha-(1->4)-GalNAc-alpha-(1->3)-diNAcBac-PP-undecaprenol alpha-1,4-N-acetyl-D-galactosaminyltransferase